MRRINRFVTIGIKRKGVNVYVGAYADDKTADRVLKNIKDFVKVGDGKRR